MRFVLAITALVLSGVMLILGIGQVTFLAGPYSVKYSTALDAPNGLAVIDAEQLTASPGQANVIVEGDAAFVAVGAARDVEAWLAPFDHARVEAQASERQLVVTGVSPEAEAATAYAELVGAAEDEEVEVPSPYGSDLWLEQRGLNPAEAEAVASEGDEADPTAVSDAQKVRLPVSLSDDQAVLVSAADTGAEPTVSIEWVQDRRTPWAGPLLVGGGVLAIVGAVLYLLAVDHDRRGLGPRRGRRGPLLGIRNLFGGGKRSNSQKPSDTTTESAGKSGPRRASRLAVLPALGLASILTLSGCSANYWPEIGATTEEDASEQVAETTNLAPVPVKQVQIDRIIAEISALAGEADDTLDDSGLDARFTGDALEERVANYKIRNAVSDYEVVVPRITDEMLGYQLVQSTETWPRTVFVVVASESTGSEEAAADEAEEGEEAEAVEVEESPSLAIIMTQNSPHENFLVSRTIALRGGITMPEAAPAEEGTALLADDMATLVKTPAEVGPAYAKILASGTGVDEAEFFNLEGDSLVERSGAAWVAQSKEAAAAAGQGIVYSVSAKQSDAKIVSLSTGVGGALVANTVLETRVEQPEEGSRWRPTVPKSLAALSGLEGQQDKLVSVVAHQLLFYVPSATSDEPIQLLGYTSDLVAASNE